MDSLASPFTESKDLVFACTTDSPLGACSSAQADTRSLDFTRSSANGRSCSARDDRVEEESLTNGMRGNSRRRFPQPFVAGDWIILRGFRQWCDRRRVGGRLALGWIASAASPPTF